jgi:hypothetical protein
MIRVIALTIVVLPVPGPPVMTVTFPSTACRTARRWASEKRIDSLF